MRPDDPRHGTYAGAKAHQKARVPMCPDCTRASTREYKRMKHRIRNGVRNRIPIGQEAWNLLVGIPAPELARITGLRVGLIYTLRMGDAESNVLRSTRDTLLKARGRSYVTPIGLQRRLQALGILGYSMQQISAGTGLDLDGITRLRRRENVTHCHPHMYKPILAFYDAHHMKPEPASRKSSRVANYARAMGWASPMAWENIDDPGEKPKGIPGSRGGNTVDEAAVLRRMQGDRTVRLSHAERCELVRQWRRSGRTLKEMSRITGINKPERYAA